MDDLILASASEGRKKLFEKYFKSFQVSTSDFDERSVYISDPFELSRILACQKAIDVSERYPDDFVIGFDTIVLCEGRIIGKPGDKAEAKRLLSFLSGKRQSVISGYALINLSKDIEITGVGVTDLFFKVLDDKFISEYVEANPVTKYAGGYGVQDRDELVTILEGSFDNVIGAPMEEVALNLKRAGLPEAFFRPMVI
jgi:septum formation protein